MKSSSKQRSAEGLEQTAAEFLRALRGSRSQAVFARRLGYRSNVAHNWEHGRSWPSAARTLWIAERLGLDVRLALGQFYRLAPSWLDQTDVTSSKGLSLLLRDLKGKESVAHLAQVMGKSRFTLTRWLNAKTEPKLPEFLHYVECSTLRLLDFIAVFVDPAALPSLRPQWIELQQARRLAYDEPWSQAVLRALELVAYRQRKAHSSAWLAARLGISGSHVDHCLQLLADSGQIAWEGQHWKIKTVRALDTGRDREAAQALRAWWGQVGVERAKAGKPGAVYNLFGVSRFDLERLRLLQKNYLSEVRNIVAQSSPVESVVLAVDMLLDLESGT
jgi:transcriptional regulator with XRE-family HTH domain